MAVLTTSFNIIVQENIDPTGITWANASWQQVKKMLDWHRRGEINIYEQDGWEIGATRKVSLSEMPATYVGESHVAQDVTFMLVDDNSIDLVGGGKSIYVAEQLNGLNPTVSSKAGFGYMNPTDTNAGGWKNCARRSWCNQIYYNALPQGFREVIKTSILKTTKGNLSTEIEETQDNVWLASMIQIDGSEDMTNRNLSYSHEENTLFKYYNPSTTNKKIKYRKDGTTQYKGSWWLRSPNTSHSDSFGLIGYNGVPQEYGVSTYNQELDTLASRNQMLIPHVCI